MEIDDFLYKKSVRDLANDPLASPRHLFYSATITDEVTELIEKAIHWAFARMCRVGLEDSSLRGRLRGIGARKHRVLAFVEAFKAYEEQSYLVVPTERMGDTLLGALQMAESYMAPPKIVDAWSGSSWWFSLWRYGLHYFS